MYESVRKGTKDKNMRSKKSVRKFFHAPKYDIPINRNGILQPGVLKPGDIGLSIGSKVFSGLMRNVYEYPFTHAFVYLGNGKVLEALNKRVEIHHISRYAKADFVMVSWKEISNNQRKVLVDTALTYEGMKYDYPALSWLVMRGLIYTITSPLTWLFGRKRAKKLRLITNLMARANAFDIDSKKICSEVIADASLKAGLPTKLIKSGHESIAPGHLADPRLFIWKLIHSKK